MLTTVATFYFRAQTADGHGLGYAHRLWVERKAKIEQAFQSRLQVAVQDALVGATIVAGSKADYRDFGELADLDADSEVA